MCVIRFKWREVPVPVVREGNWWVGGWVDCIYTKSAAFIQFQTGIYTIPDWHLYNSTLAFIQVMSLLHFLPKLFMALCHEQHVQSKCMLSMAECCPIFLFPSQNSSWHSAMNSMRNLNACHPWQSAAQFFVFLPKTPHGTLP